MTPNVPIWVKMIHSIPTDPSGETLVEPELEALVPDCSSLLNATYLVPPVHSDQVTKPLMCKLVSDNVNNAVLVLLIRCVFVEEYGSSS